MSSCRLIAIWWSFATKKLPTPTLLSPIHFLPLLFDQVGATEPPFYALLDELRAQVPAMEQAVAYDPAGRLVDPADLSPRARKVLSDYQMVLYDLSAGERYSQASMFYPPEPTGSASASGQ